MIAIEAMAHETVQARLDILRRPVHADAPEATR
jgi:hypothetical protein